jgi:hypothetical protein
MHHKRALHADINLNKEVNMNHLEFLEKRKSVNSSEISFIRAKEVASSLNPLLKFFEPKFKFHVLPTDDLLKGKVGLAIFSVENEIETTMELQFSVSSEAKLKEYKTAKEFHKAFLDAWESKISIQAYDDPIKRLAGFITENREERIWHYIPFTRLKED